jgi:RHS repeat-associated protein
VRDRYFLAGSGAGRYTLERFYVDDLLVLFAGGPNHWGVVRIFAFGEQIAAKQLKPMVLRGAGVWPVTWPKIEPTPPLVGLLALSGLLAGGLLVRRTGGIAWPPPQPGFAAVSVCLVVLLTVPPLPAVAGGGGPTAVRRWLLSDNVGSVSVVLFADGTPRREVVLRPFGAEYDSTGPRVDQVFAGHRKEGVTGLIYMQARWQDPETGRFVSIDPLIPDASDPQAYNAYSYVRNNPISLIDPDGRDWWSALTAVPLPIYDPSIETIVIYGDRPPPPSTDFSWAYTLFAGLGTAAAPGQGGSQSNPGTSDPAFDRAVSKAVSDTSSEIRAVNDRKGLLYNPDRANRPLGSVVSKETVGIPFINQREVFVNSRPNQFVPDGLDFKGDGFIGGKHQIRNASAVVLGFSHLTPASSLSSITPSMQALSRSAGAPVFVFFTRGGFTGPIRIDAGAGP